MLAPFGITRCDGGHVAIKGCIRPNQLTLVGCQGLAQIGVEAIDGLLVLLVHTFPGHHVSMFKVVRNGSRMGWKPIAPAQLR